MPFLLTPDGIALRGTDGAPLYPGGITEDIAQVDLGQISFSGLTPSVNVAQTGVTVSPEACDIAEIGFQPSVVATAHVFAAPGEGALSVTGFSSDLRQIIRGLPGESNVIATGFPILAVATDHKRVLPGFGSLLVDGYDPIALFGASITLGPSHAQITQTGFSPSLITTDHKHVLPIQSEIIVAGLVPAALAPRTAVAGVSAISVLGFDPQIRYAIIVYPIVGAIEQNSIAAAVLLPCVSMVATGSIITTGSEPTLTATGNQWSLPAASEIALLASSPAVTSDASVVVGPVHSGLVISGMSSILAMTDRKWVIPELSAFVVSGYAATIINPYGMTVATSAISATGIIPAIIALENSFARPDRSEISVSGFPIVFVAPQTTWPSISVLTMNGQIPGLKGGISVHPDVLTMDVDFSTSSLEITEDQFARLPSGSSMVLDMFDPFLELPRIMFPQTSAIVLNGCVPISHAVIPIALQTVMAQPGGEMSTIIVKHPWSEIRVAVDWRSYLSRQETVVSSSQWIEATDLGTVLDGAFFSNGIASVEIGAGSPGSSPVVENRVSFADGSRDVFRFCVRVASLS